MPDSIETFEFDAASHTYRVNGVILPSVTQVIGWMNNYSGIPAETLAFACERGTAAHEATALDDRGLLDEESVDPEIAGYLAAWRRFRRETGFVPELIEHRVAVPGMYAGTLDRFGRIGRQYWLVDIKTATTVSRSNGPQTAAYLGALGTRDHTKRGTVQLRQDGTYRLIPHENRNDLSAFLASLTLHNWSKSND